MSFSALAYTLFTFVLAMVFAGIVVYYYRPARKEAVEAPKFSMLHDDEREESATNRRQ